MFTSYEDRYRWHEVLATSTNSHSTCLSTRHVDLFPSRPPYPEPSPAPLPDSGDRSGTHHRATWRESGLGLEFYQSAFPTISAFHQCRPISILPETAWVTALSLTDTSTSYEDSSEPTVTPTEQDTSATISTVPLTADANPTSNAVSNPPVSPSPAVTSSTTQQESTTPTPPTGDTNPTSNALSDLPVLPSPTVTSPTAHQESTTLRDTSILDLNSPDVPLSSTHQESSTSVVANIPETLPASSLGDIASHDFPTVNTIEDALTNSAVTVPIPSKTYSLSPESASAQPSPQAPNDNATPVFGSSNNSPRPVGTGGAAPITGIDIPIVTSHLADPPQIISEDGNLATPIIGVVATPYSSTPKTSIENEINSADSATEDKVIGGETLHSGPATILGPRLSTAVSGLEPATNGPTNAISNTVPYSVGPSLMSALTPAPPMFTIDGSIYTANSANQYEIAPGITIAPGGPAQTVSGTTISLAPSASYIVVNEATSTLATATAAAAVVATLTPAPSLLYPVLTIDGSTYAQSGSQYIIEGQTLGIDSAITIGSDSSTTVVELQTATNGATEVIIEHSSSRSTFIFTPAETSISIRIPSGELPPLTLAGQTYTANSLTQYSLGPDLTLAPGGVVTLSGTKISIEAPEGSDVAGSSTESLSAPMAISVNAGPDVSATSSFQGGNSSSPANIIATANGAGKRRSGRSNGLQNISMIGIIVAGYLGGL